MSQDIEIDPDSRTITYYEKPTMNLDLEDIKSRALYQQGGPNPAQVLIHESDFNYLLVEVNRLRKDCEHHKQAALDISDENDRLRKLVPPESECGPGFVGQGSWSVYAEKVVAERDAARERMKQLLEEKIELRDELGGLCEDIRVLKEAFDDFKEESAIRVRELLKENSELHGVNAGLQEEVTRCGSALASKKEHANIHLGGKGELHGIDGYGPFNLKQVDKDRWEIWMLHEKVTLYNKKGHRVRGDHNYEGDW